MKDSFVLSHIAMSSIGSACSGLYYFQNGSIRYAICSAILIVSAILIFIFKRKAIAYLYMAFSITSIAFDTPGTLTASFLMICSFKLHENKPFIMIGCASLLVSIIIFYSINARTSTEFAAELISIVIGVVAYIYLLRNKNVLDPIMLECCEYKYIKAILEDDISQKECASKFGVKDNAISQAINRVMEREGFKTHTRLFDEIGRRGIVERKN